MSIYNYYVKRKCIPEHYCLLFCFIIFYNKSQGVTWQSYFVQKNFFGNMYKKRAHTRHKTEQIFFVLPVQMLQENEETPAKDARRRPVCRARNKFPCASTEHESAQKTTRPEKRPEDRPRGRPLLLEAPGCGPCSKTRLPRFKCSTHFDDTRWRYFWL